MLTIGRVARTVGIRSSAIRYYERHGIIEPAARGANGYRFYNNDAVKLLLFIRRAQTLGIRLEEIKPLLNLASQWAAALQSCKAGCAKPLTRSRSENPGAKNTS